MDIKFEILNQLIEADGQDVSGEKLRGDFGITRAAVWKHINALRELGWDIAAVPRRGYRLEHLPDLLHPACIAPFRRTEGFAAPIQHLFSCDSTNLLLKRMANEGAPHGSTVFAEEQTAGRGRLGRVWQSEAGGLYMSVLLRPDMMPYDAQTITLLAALAVLYAIGEETPLRPELKWPNDVLLNDKKVCGILTEISGTIEKVDWIVIGIGINVGQLQFPLEIQDMATSIAQCTPQCPPRALLAASILDMLFILYNQWMENGAADIIERILPYCSTIGKQVNYTKGREQLTGIATGIDARGRLIIDDSEYVFSGEVTVKK